MPSPEHFVTYPAASPTSATRPTTRRGRMCSGIGCASTFITLGSGPSRSAQRSRIAAWYSEMAGRLTTVPVPTPTWSYLGKTHA